MRSRLMLVHQVPRQDAGQSGFTHDDDMDAFAERVIGSIRREV
jgi:hypothetical protein